MPITLNVQQSVVNSWTPARCLGARKFPSGDIALVFKLEASGETADILFRGGSVKMATINKLRMANGLDPYEDMLQLDLPVVGDQNMMGYDRPIEVYVIENKSKSGKTFLTIRDIRKVAEPGAYEPAFGDEAADDGVPDWAK